MEIVELETVLQQSVSVGSWNCEAADTHDAFIILTQKPTLIRFKPSPTMSLCKNSSIFHFKLIDYAETLKTHPIVKNMDSNLDMDTVCSLISGSNFSQIELSFASSHTIPCSASWGPESSQIFALLFDTGSVSFWNGHSGELMLDMTNHIHTLYIKTDINVNKRNLPELKNVCDSVFVTAICWCEKVFRGDSESFTFFVTAHKSGKIHIWKTVFTSTWEIGVNVVLSHTFQTTAENISTIRWISKNDSHYLVYADATGQILCTLLNILNIFSFSSNADSCLWSKDRMPVSKIVHFNRKNEHFHIIAIKTNLIVIIVMDSNCTVLQTCVKDENYTKITGINIIDDANFIMCTWTGSVYRMKLIMNANNEPNIDSEKVNLDVNFNMWSLRGLLSTKNNLFHLLSLSPAKNAMKKNEKFTTKIVIAYTKVDNPIDALKENESQCLTDYWDYLELARIMNEKLPETSANWPVVFIDEMNPYRAKLCLWLNVIKQKPQNIVQSQSKLFYLIMFDHVKKSLLEFAEKYQKGELSAFQLKTIQIYVTFLQNYDGVIKRPNSIEGLRKIFELFKDILPIVERKCIWCNEEIKTILCSKTHPRQWCCITLQEIEEAECLKCPICGSVAHPELVLDNPKCTFCDVYLLRS